MIEFKQIIGRGTRLYDGKDYFTIYDFVKAYLHFSDPEWDGEPLEPEPCKKCGYHPCQCVKTMPTATMSGLRQEPVRMSRRDRARFAASARACARRKAKVKLADGKERTIQHMVCTTFWHPDGTPMSAQQFMELLFGKLPEFFKRRSRATRACGAPPIRGRSS